MTTLTTPQLNMALAAVRSRNSTNDEVGRDVARVMQRGKEDYLQYLANHVLSDTDQHWEDFMAQYVPS